MWQCESIRTSRDLWKPGTKRQAKNETATTKTNDWRIVTLDQVLAFAGKPKCTALTTQRSVRLKPLAAANCMYLLQTIYTVQIRHMQLRQGSARVAGRASDPPTRRRTARAFSRWRLIARVCSSLPSSAPASSPVRAATQCASCRQVCMATGAQPPLAASATKGMNWRPSLAQVAAVCKWARLRAS